MNDYFEKHANVGYRCPVCNVRLSAEPALPAYDAPCPDCGSSLWCGKMTVNGVATFHVLPGRTPEHADIERLATSLLKSSGVPRMVLDLSNLESITSSLMARLVALNKRVRGAKGRLVLCGLSPVVQEVFRHTRIETLFEVVDTVRDALDTLKSPRSSAPGRTMSVEDGPPGADATERKRPSRDQVRPGRNERSDPFLPPPSPSKGLNGAVRPISFMLWAS